MSAYPLRRPIRHVTVPFWLIPPAVVAFAAACPPTHQQAEGEEEPRGV
ncbi:hypothetical protein VTH82DRAFT_2019 [Thermothelomyces myriococcoides]